MRLLCSIILVPFRAMYRFRHHFPMCYAIAPQFIGHDLPGFTLVTPQQTLEEALRSSPIPFSLKIDIYHFTILVNRSPQVMLLTVDFDEDLINVESVTVSSVLSLQSAGVNGTEFDTPKADRFSADGDSPLGQYIFNVSVAKIESVVEPDGVGYDIGRESVALICAHGPILPESAS